MTLSWIKSVRNYHIHVSKLATYLHQDEVGSYRPARRHAVDSQASSIALEHQSAASFLQELVVQYGGQSMQDDQYDALMQIFRKEDSTTARMENGVPAEKELENPSRRPDSPEWITVMRCLKRIRRWRVPPQWSGRDWLDEIMGEVTLSVVQATKDFDMSRGIPLGAFLHRRIIQTALARYRREWTYAIHQISEAAVDEYEAVKGTEYPSREAISSQLREALARLPSSDATLIEEIFWKGKSEARLAQALGISQQAVNKRKHNIFRLLDDIIRSRFPQIAPWNDSV
jgi:RNA polymerase sigma factor (sigma-70 family)